MTPADYLTRLHKARIAVIYGGTAIAGQTVDRVTGEGRGKTYESVARDIASALRLLGFTTVDIVAEDALLAQRLMGNYDLVWINSGGVQGAGGMAHAPSACESLGLPYVGHSPFAVASLDDKSVFKARLMAAGIPTAKFCDFASLEHVSRSYLREFFAGTDPNERFVVKPISGRASLNVEVAPSLDDVPKIIDGVRAATGGASVIVEEYLSGAEYAVAVGGGNRVARGKVITPQASPFAFSPIERVLDSDELIFTSMDTKAITTSRMRLVTGEMRAGLISLAQHVHRQMDLETAVRLDVRADKDGVLKILECNPKPDLAKPTGDKTSLICAGLVTEGMDYQDLILTILANRLDFLQHRRPKLFSSLASLIEAA